MNSFDPARMELKMLPTMKKKPQPKNKKHQYSYRPSDEVMAAVVSYQATQSPPDRLGMAKLIDKVMREFLRNVGHTPADEPPLPPDTVQ